MNVIAQLEYELAYYDSTVHHFNHFSMQMLIKISIYYQDYSILVVACYLCSCMHMMSIFCLADDALSSGHWFIMFDVLMCGHESETNGSS